MQNTTQQATQKTLFFTYTKSELDSLKSKDKRLAKAIEKIGEIKREVDSDLFASVVHHIIAQQISTKAQASIWARFCQVFGTRTNATHKPAQENQSLSVGLILSAGSESIDNLRYCGISGRKAEYIIDFARKVQAREFDIERVKKMSDKEAIDELVKLRGIGVWTAEMILLFCLQRKDIFSYDDLAIQRGLKMLYGIKDEGKQDKIPKEIFAKYRAKFSPYCSLASLYLWEIASRGIEI